MNILRAIKLYYTWSAPLQSLQPCHRIKIHSNLFGVFFPDINQKVLSLTTEEQYFEIAKEGNLPNEAIPKLRSQRAKDKFLFLFAISNSVTST